VSPLLSARGLVVEYPTSRGVVRAVDGIDVTVEDGEIVGLVGVSGAGKSTAALALMGLVPAPGRVTGGENQFGRRDLRGLPDEEMRRIRGDEMSLVVQNPRGALNPMLSIGRQIANVVRAHADVSRAQARERAVEMLRLVGINDPERRVDAYPHELSGGMAQRALIAMALSCTPKLLIADEPTSGLDVTIQAQILDDLNRSVQTTGSAALIVTQDLGVVANYCDRVLVMYAGRVVESVPVTGFFTSAGHPAAEALLSSQSDEGQVRLRPGAVDYLDLPRGCKLAPRCPWVVEGRCTDEEPNLRAVHPGHEVRCVRYEEIRPEIEDRMALRKPVG